MNENSETPAIAAEEAVPETPAAEHVTVETAAGPAFDAAALRSEWARRIRQEARLPGGVRQRLAALVEASATASPAHEEPQLSVSQVAHVLAETLPTLVAASPRVATHPQGERFFSGEGFAAEEAARVARAQLERAGFARETD